MYNSQNCRSAGCHHSNRDTRLAQVLFSHNRLTCQCPNSPCISDDSNFYHDTLFDFSTAISCPETDILPLKMNFFLSRSFLFISYIYIYTYTHTHTFITYSFFRSATSLCLTAVSVWVIVACDRTQGHCYTR
jgi:hypothetical protein